MVLPEDLDAASWFALTTASPFGASFLLQLTKQRGEHTPTRAIIERNFIKYIYNIGVIQRNGEQLCIYISKCSATACLFSILASASWVVAHDTL